MRNYYAIIVFGFQLFPGILLHYMPVSHELDGYKRFDAWAAMTPNKQLFDLEAEGLRTVLDHFKPYQTLVLGSDVAVVAAREAMMVRLTHNAGRGLPADVEASYHLLPFADESFDLIVCPHIQELVPCEARFFAELSRVMMSEGLLVLYGVNPMGVLQWSNWAGMGNKYAWLRRTYYRKALSEALGAYGFDYVYHGYGVHQLSLGQEKDVMHLSRWLPSCGGVYKLVLRRRRVTPTVCVAEEWVSQSMDY